MGSKTTERFRHGDPVRVVSRGGTVWHGIVDDYGELGERMQLRVNIPDCGTCRYYYDPDTNLFEDCDDADLKLAVHHEFEPGDRALVRAEGSLHSVSTLVLEYRGSSGQLRVEMEDREGPRELEYEFDAEEGWWHDDDMFAVFILPDRTAKETEMPQPTPKDHTELPNVLAVYIKEGGSVVLVDALALLQGLFPEGLVDSDPGVWGVILADVVRSVANAHHEVISALMEKQQQGAPPAGEDFLRRVREVLDNELDRPSTVLEARQGPSGEKPN